MQEENIHKKAELIKELGNIIRRHRKEQNKTMYSISAEASMSKSTWREAELGVCKDINLTTLVKISEGLNIPLSKLIEELYCILGNDFSLTDL